jgi:glyoxylase-like metal-dependent hydrolase (beta-lactamase superfamily II)
VLLVEDRFLFTGDRLDWDRDTQYSWPQQAESMERLADYRFERVLPGHGQKVHLPAARMREQILRLAESMREKS